MKNNLKQWLTIICLSSVLIIGIKSVGWTGQSIKPMELLANGAMFPPVAPEGRAFKYFCDEVTKRTDGKIKFKHVWTSALTRPGEEFGALGKGVGDVAIVVSIFHWNKLYLNQFTEAVPFKPSDPMKQFELIRKVHQRVPDLGEEWKRHKTRLLAPFVTAENHVQAREPIKTLVDFKGKKIDITGYYPGKSMEAVGGVLVAVSLPDTAMALQTGTVDVEVLALTATHPFGIWKFAPHVTFIGHGAYIGVGLAANLNKFNSFSPELQKIFIETAWDASTYFARGQVGFLKKILKDTKEKGVSYYELSREDKVKWANLMGNYPLDWVKKGKERGLPTKKVMRTYLELVEETGHKFPKEWKID
jgi:TRAP-type C4-dicarboxylate transport system substrate-binding protein